MLGPRNGEAEALLYCLSSVERVCIHAYVRDASVVLETKTSSSIAGRPAVRPSSEERRYKTTTTGGRRLVACGVLSCLFDAATTTATDLARDD